jgi:hypothetical protein
MIEWFKVAAHIVFVVKLADKITEIFVEQLGEDERDQVLRWLNGNG